MLIDAACGNYTKFTIHVQLGTVTNWSNFEVKRSKVKVKVTTEPNMVKITCLEMRYFDEDILCVSAACSGE